MSEERVCIIKTEEITTVKESLDQIKTAIIDCMTVRKDESKNLDMFLFVDLSLFNIINSSVIGVLGSVLMDPSIRLVGLCGVQPPVREILTRFGVLPPVNTNQFEGHENIKNNRHKVVTFETIEQGLDCLDPT